jgi:hypothetical protein
MTKQATGKLNWLAQNLPEGLLVDAAWLSERGYSTALRSQYLKAKWLVQPTRGVYRRPQGSNLSWQQVVISLQTLLLRSPLTVGGRTALDLQGYAHFLKKSESEIHLYGPKPPPTWLYKLPLRVLFHYRNDKKLFRNEPVHFGTTSLAWDVAKNKLAEVGADASFTVQPWGQWDWPLTLSTPERAILELLDEVPDRETFHQADMLFGGLSGLRPRRLEKLLKDCKSVKVKRLFFFFADRHKHAWLKHLDRASFDLGAGKRMLVKGGKYDSVHQITVPEDLNGDQ